jgi:TetR/AcrR family transcriptional regulator, transcriptional repressor for nem operon
MPRRSQTPSPSSSLAPGKAHATRTALIDAAAKAFVETGYGAMSVRDLARRLQMTTGAIYGHFRGKANLLGEAVRLRIDRDLEGENGPKYPETRLAEYLAHNFRDYRKRRALRALVVEGAAAARVDDDVRALLHDVLSERQARWAKQYRDAWIAEGLDPEIDPTAVLAFVWAAELGLGVLEALDITLPKPAVLGSTVARLVGSLGDGRARRQRRS